MINGNSSLPDPLLSLSDPLSDPLSSLSDPLDSLSSLSDFPDSGKFIHFVDENVSFEGRNIKQLNIKKLDTSANPEKAVDLANKGCVVLIKETADRKEFKFDPAWIDKFTNVEQITIRNEQGEIEEIIGRGKFEIKAQSREEMLYIALKVNYIAQKIFLEKNKNHEKEDDKLAIQLNHFNFSTTTKTERTKVVEVSAIVNKETSNVKLNGISKVLSAQLKMLAKHKEEDREKQIENNYFELKHKIIQRDVQGRDVLENHKKNNDIESNSLMVKISKDILIKALKPPRVFLKLKAG